jgi:hypothetical protein
MNAPPHSEEPKRKRDTTPLRIALIVLPFAVIGVALALFTGNQKPASPTVSTNIVPTQIAPADSPSASAIARAVDKSIAQPRVGLRVYDKQVVGGAVTRLTLANEVVNSPWAQGSLRWTGTVQTALRGGANIMSVITHFDGSPQPLSYVRFRSLKLKPGKDWLQTRTPLSVHETANPQSPTVSSSTFSSGQYLPQSLLPAVKDARTYLKPLPLPNPGAVNYRRYSGTDSVRQIAYTLDIYISGPNAGYVRRIVIVRAALGDQGQTNYVTAATYVNYGKAKTIQAPPPAQVQKQQ